MKKRSLGSLPGFLFVIVVVVVISPAGTVIVLEAGRDARAEGNHWWFGFVAFRLRASRNPGVGTATPITTTTTTTMIRAVCFQNGPDSQAIGA